MDKPLSGKQRKFYRNNCIISPADGVMKVTEGEIDFSFEVAERVYSVTKPIEAAITEKTSVKKGEIIVRFSKILDIVEEYYDGKNFSIDPQAEKTNTESEQLLEHIYNVLHNGKEQFAYRWYYVLPSNALTPGMALKLKEEKALEAIEGGLPVRVMHRSRYITHADETTVRLRTKHYKEVVFDSRLVSIDVEPGRLYEAGEQVGRFVRSMEDLDIIQSDKRALERISDCYMLENSIFSGDKVMVPARLAFSKKMENFEKVLVKGESLGKGPLPFNDDGYVDFGDVRVFRHSKLKK